MPTRILVIDADLATQRVAVAALREQGYDVDAVEDGAAGLKHWEAQPPDVILVDSAAPRLNGYELAANIRARETTGHVPIVMLTAGEDVSEKVRVFRAGADAHITKPIHAGELVARVRGLLARYAPASVGGTGAGSPGRVLAFYGAKGGVGTTTIAINAAIALRRELHRKVALVDGRLQFGDHRIFLDLGLDRRTILDAVTAPTIDVDLLKGVLVQHDSGVDLLLSPPSPEAADHVRQDDLSRILTLLRTLYDYVLIDVESRLDEMTLHVLDVADFVMVVMTPDLPSLKNVRMLMETVGRLGWERNKINLVLNRASATTGVSVRSLESALERPIDYMIINEYRTAITAVNTGAPFLSTRPGSPLGRSVVDMVRAIDAGSRLPGAANAGATAAGARGGIAAVGRTAARRTGPTP